MEGGREGEREREREREREEGVTGLVYVLKDGVGVSEINRCM